MKNRIILWLSLILSLQTAAQRGYWQQQLRYDIDVTLNDKDHSLEAFMKLEYVNHSPDTLHYIWFHLWPNAFKNDKTAFSDQLLENGRTDFYFSPREDKGYINRLDFRTDNIALKQEDHPVYIDIVKVLLLSPLAPGDSVSLSTPFHVKLPKDFSRGGHVGKAYQVTQWYPKPAVYDHKGWHEMPYLDQGEFYGEFSDYDVKIHLPGKYLVAATGELQNGHGRQEMVKPADSAHNRMLHYRQENVHDFAWFADRNFSVAHDTIALASGRIIDAYAYYLPGMNSPWKNAVSGMKNAIRFRSAAIGEYPFNVVTAVEAKMGVDGGMEYPTITSIAPMPLKTIFEETLAHEIGHNWFYGIVGNNERAFPWMDEGLNTYYDHRYAELRGARETDDLPLPGWLKKRIPGDPAQYLLNALAKEKNDQPISTGSEKFAPVNYAVISYTKTANWLSALEKQLGRTLFDSCMRVYYNEWKFRHPYPDDFRRSLEASSGKDLSAHFALLDTKGAIPALKINRPVRPAFIFSARNSDSVRYINMAPMVGYNQYDGFMVGMLAHNFNLPAERLSFITAPLYAPRSRRITGSGAIVYSWFPDNSRFKKIQAGLNGSTFSIRDGIDSIGKKVFAGFYKIAPFVRLTFTNREARSNSEKWLEWKTFFIGERSLDYHIYSVDSSYYPAEGKQTSRYLNQLTFNAASYRALYPYDVQLQLQQGESFYRLNATAHYFFNYAKGGGMQIRAFAAKFGYLGGKSSSKEFQTYAYQPKLTAVRGNEDYTYSNYFIGRNESDGLGGRQIMMRDGGLKLRTDLFQNLQGRSDNWIASLNFNTTIPQFLPVKIPLKLFADVGTYADAWDKSFNNSRFMYVAGLQLSLFKGLLDIYAPVLLSKEFRDNLKTVGDENSFAKRISFSVNVQRFNLRRLTGNKFPF